MAMAIAPGTAIDQATRPRSEGLSGSIACEILDSDHRGLYQDACHAGILRAAALHDRFMHWADAAS